MTRVRHVAAVAFVLAAVAGCNGGRDPAVVEPATGSHSPYCKTYRAWKVYELDHGEGFDQPDPAALRRFWSAYLRSEEALLRQAPPGIRAAVEVKVRFLRTRLGPTLEKYAFDLRRAQRQGTPAEQAAVFGGPPPDVEKAQAVAYAYEDRACGTQPAPPPADVVFTGSDASRAFCKALSAFDAALDRIAASHFDPKVMRAVVTGSRFEDALDALDATAPPEVAGDVRADTAWFHGRWAEVVASYDYDLRKIYVDATPEDLAVFNRTHRDVLAHTSRTTAYEEQVCDG